MPVAASTSAIEPEPEALGMATREPSGLQTSVTAALEAKVPTEFWLELRKTGLVDPDAPLPQDV